VPDLKERYASMGLTLGGGTPKQFEDFLISESKKWNPIIEDLQKSGL
jgi:tripartite-type tricarboxylate transporter receptor subunit TctC